MALSVFISSTSRDPQAHRAAVKEEQVSRYETRLAELPGLEPLGISGPRAR